MAELRDIDILIVGAGPAGFAAAIQLKKRLNAAKRPECVVVIDKASKPGYHALSGSVLEPQCLDDLLPDWREEPNGFAAEALTQFIDRDEVCFLTAHKHLRIPECLLPASMRHKKDLAVSVGKLAAWLTGRARAIGVEIYQGFTAQDLFIQDGVVRGVILMERGRDADGQKQAHYQPEEMIAAKAVVLADGCLGTVSTKLIAALHLDRGKHPQVYSVGIKQLLRLPQNNIFGKRRSVHTIGYPSPLDVFGGGFLYDMGRDILAIGLILGLDWKYSDLDPQNELERFKKHPFIQEIIRGGEVMAAGAKMIPEGGYYAMPKPYGPGALLVGDALGLVNIAKFKGIHLAIQSGIAAGDALFTAVQKNDFSEDTLQSYTRNLEQRGVMAEMRQARNFRQVFSTPGGMLLGMPLSFVQQWIPFPLKMGLDYTKTRRARRGPKTQTPIDGKMFSSLSGTTHDEKAQAHIKIKDAGLCQVCQDLYACPCQGFCPAKVYSLNAERLLNKNTEDFVIVSASDCVHCKTCVVKCPYNNILWTSPEGGAGPRYRQM